MAEVQIAAEQRQAGQQRDTRQRQRQTQRTAAGSAPLPHMGKQEQQCGVRSGKQHKEAEQPRRAVDGLLGQGDAVNVQLALVVGDGGGQVLHPRTEADPKPGRQAAVAVVQPQRVKGHGGGAAFTGKGQRPGSVEHIKRGRVGGLAGKITDCDLIRTGRQSNIVCREGHRVVAVIADLVPDF